IDTGYALAQTEVMLTYDESNLYIAIICHDTFPGKRPIESLRRDWSFPKNDNFIAFIDTYNDQTNGFAFGISAAGAQWDGLQANGGFVSLDWDTKWKSVVKNYADRWVAEFSIPFRSIRYRYGETEWGINFSRLDLKTNEKSSWAPVPRQFQTANLAFTGTLVWDRPLPESGTRFSLIPYISSKATQDVAAGENINIDAAAGLDAKVILSTSLNLDLTLNPDFSQVEVDRQRTNLDRFELFFPEKRQFFLENSDLFASLGTENIRPFFSRQIGLSNPVQAGARLSGQLGENWRIGLMDIQTGTKNDIRAANFGVAVIQRQIFSRSNITAFMINKQITSPMGGEDTSYSGYNRVAGIDLNLSSADSRWTGKAFYHQSFYPGASVDASTLAGQFTYETQQFSASLNQAWVGPDYLAEVGYIRRKGFYQINPTIEYKFFPKSRRITNHGPILELDLFYKPDLSLTDREIQ
ncbi:MAG: carbohydrate binding family 9 domain-containing protein, partial [Bacteroidales bacterium]|nr:carbohydrate binding family 9 domain-containing protein [Bacteroidales bacterium]